MVVADTVYFVCLVEVQQPEAVEVDAQFHAAARGHVVVAVLHYHVLELGYHRGVVAVGISGAHINSEHEIGCEGVVHHIHRKVVVDTAVVETVAVNLYGVEHQRERHAGAYGVAYLSAGKYRLVLFVYVRGHASERHEEFVEIGLALGGEWREQLHEGEVHGERIYKRGGQQGCESRLFASQI